VTLGRECDRRSLTGIGDGVVGEIAEDTVEQRLVAFDDELAGQIVVKRHMPLLQLQGCLLLNVLHHL